MKQLPTVDWSRPGENRYTGPIDKAIMTYTDIPLDVRHRLVERATAKSKQYDEIVTIDKAGIRGGEHSYVNLRQMFFGTHHRAESVTRDAWLFDHEERAMVFTEDDREGVAYTIILPHVCSNVARVDKVPLIAAAAQNLNNMPHSAPTIQVNTVPEPSTLALLGPGLLALLLMRRRALSRG